MVKFIPVRYSNKDYPPDFKPQPRIQETTANFFRKTIEKTNLDNLSLHTDPPRVWYGMQKDKILSSEFLKDFPAILNNMIVSGYSCVSKLWCNDKRWGKDFSNFLVRLTEKIDSKSIKLIEIHPPFDKYCKSLDIFLERYSSFEEEVSKKFPSATICIENRCNTPIKSKYGKFILSTNKHIIELSKLISRSNLKLKLVVDIPQLFSEHYENKLISEAWMIEEVLTPLRDVRDSIISTHIWGKTIKGAHNADLNVYFGNNQKVKNCFLQEIFKLFDDGKARYFVPEVNNSLYVQSIVNDLKNAGIKFVKPE